ncbi:hypothetical protein CC1G_08197 [Coprinopsis cinerea okayama7|uniref:Uncharacterized protein n=1 Tax=Coprinopsis cinerea (strain Okayama-7 / 130 / ATCC MYA-4618 / FGSC 9003) TaxID=240176 RepID=A8P7C4_COPC7|nr:hypothetical protein CC1G_08197 [Coprinopsis cinerea okayama7\|eukprot:XP_001839330.2 hypothetical protein CC1G_08197 [Coprinopsis cinerea okayama7\
MVFYPDNQGRARRLEQLVNSTVNMQTDIQYSGDQLKKQTKSMQSEIDKIFKQEGIDTLDDLYNKASSVLPESDIATFRALVDAAKKSTKLDVTTLTTGLLLPFTLGAGATPVASAGRFIVRTALIDSLGTFFKSAAQGEKAAQTAAEALSKLTEETSEAIKGKYFHLLIDRQCQAASAAAKAGTEGAAAAAEEAAQAAKSVSKLAAGLRVITAVGFCITAVMMIMEAVEGAQQKTKLIDGIHKCQPARLCVAYFKAEAENITQRTELIRQYLEALSSSKEDPDAKAAAELYRKKILEELQKADFEIDWRQLETKLRNSDVKDASFYGANDLHFEDVIRQARQMEHEQSA